MAKVKLLYGKFEDRIRNVDLSKVDLVLSDLPYNITQNRWECEIDLSFLWSTLSACAPRVPFVFNAAEPFTSALVVSSPCFKYRYTWFKHKVTNFLNAKKQPLRVIEDVTVHYRKQPTYNPQFSYGHRPYVSVRTHRTDNYGSQRDNVGVNDGRRYPTDLIDIPQVRVKGGHPTQKPVELMEFFVLTYTNKGDTVLDLSMGSGTTGEACARTGRSFIGIEKDAYWFQHAKERLTNGKKRKQMCTR